MFSPRQICMMSDSIKASLSFLSFHLDCKLTSRERAKLCFRATRCKPYQGGSYRNKQINKINLLFKVCSFELALIFLFSSVSSYLECCREIHLCRRESGKWTGKLKAKYHWQFIMTDICSRCLTLLCGYLWWLILSKTKSKWEVTLVSRFKLHPTEYPFAHSPRPVCENLQFLKIK